MTIEQLRTRVMEASLAWQLAVDDERAGRPDAGPGMTNVAAVMLYRAIKAYRAATR